MKKSMEETLQQLKDALATFDGQVPKADPDPQMAEAFNGLQREMLRMQKNLEELQKNMPDDAPASDE